MASGDPKRMLPIVAEAFAELGYRRATTAVLAKRCAVRENLLYRAWPSKKQMFLAAIDHVWERSVEIWQRLLTEAGTTGADSAWVILNYEATHHGETGLYRVIFAGLTESDDPQIAAALRRMYQRFHRFIAEHIAAARSRAGTAPSRRRAGQGRGMTQPSDELTAWGLLGLATVANIGLELKLFRASDRAMLFTRLAKLLIAPRAVGKHSRPQ